MWNEHWSIMKPAYFIIWFSFNNNFRFSIKWYSRAQKVIQHKYVKYTWSMETVQQNGRFTLFSSKFPWNIYSILFGSQGRKHWSKNYIFSLMFPSTSCSWHTSSWGLSLPTTSLYSCSSSTPWLISSLYRHPLFLLSLAGYGLGYGKISIYICF